MHEDSIDESDTHTLQQDFRVCDGRQVAGKERGLPE